MAADMMACCESSVGSEAVETNPLTEVSTIRTRSRQGGAVNALGSECVPCYLDEIGRAHV